MVITQFILDMLEDYFPLGEIEIDDNSIGITVNDSEDSVYALREMDHLAKDLSIEGFTVFRSFQAGSIRFYLKKER